MKKPNLPVSILMILALILTSTALAADSDEDTSVGVDVEHTCLIGQDELNAPGNTSTDVPVMGIDKIGAFSTMFYNYGNVDINASVWLNVTEQNELWSPGDPVGDPVDLSLQNDSVIGPNTSIVNNTFRTHSITMSDESPAVYNSGANYIQGYHTVPDYGSGNFTGRMFVEYSCESPDGDLEKDKFFLDYANFIVLDVPGESGGVNTTGNNTAPPEPENINNSGDSNATIGDSSGNETTDATSPENYSETGNQTVNDTFPFPGDSSEPGETEVPEPEPEPEPTPGDSPDPGESRTPRVQIDVEPVNNTYPATQGQFSPARLEIENIGERAANNVEIAPEIDQVRPGWGSRPAEIANLSVNETVTRDVFVQPPEDQEPGTYVVPVEATNGERMLDLDYFSVKVNRSEFITGVEIQEAPESVTVTSNSSQPLPVLVQNTGERELTNVSAELQNAEDCGQVTTSNVDRIGINESASLDVGMQATSESQNCNATLIISSDQGAYSFSNIEFTVTPDEGLIPQSQRAPFLAIIWTIVLAGYAVLRKKYDLNSSLVKIPFILLLVGETVILLYMIVNYYGLVSVSFLPF
jgi:hypothetical protein